MPSVSETAFPYVNYAGIELYYVQQLDTAALYENDASDGLAAADAAGALILGPRYYWLNTEHLKLVLHSRKFMQRGKAMHHPNQPFTWVIPTDTYANLIATTPSDGVIGFPSDGVHLLQYESGWSPWGPLLPMTAVPTSGWSSVNSPVVTTSGGTVFVTGAAAAADNLRLYVRTLPAAPYVVTMAYLADVASQPANWPDGM